MEIRDGMRVCRICVLPMKPGEWYHDEKDCITALKSEVSRLNKLVIFDEGVVTQGAYNAMKCQMLDCKAEVERLKEKLDYFYSSDIEGDDN